MHTELTAQPSKNEDDLTQENEDDLTQENEDDLTTKKKKTWPKNEDDFTRNELNAHFCLSDFL